MSLEVVVGPMFAGKTSELIRLVEREVYAKRSAGIFKPSFDNRYSAEEAVTHNGLKYRAYAVSADDGGVAIIYQTAVKAGLNLIAVDEVQFFPLELVNICERLVGEGKRVVAAGLNLDFRGQPFPTTRELMVRADGLHYLTAICVRCGDQATRTQRLIEGKPAPLESPIVVIGGKELYEPRCRRCYEHSA